MGGRWGFSKATLVRVFLEDRLNGSTGVSRCTRQLTENIEDTNNYANIFDPVELLR